MNALKCAFSLAAVLGASAAVAGSLKWTGGAGTTNWGDAANWTATDGGAVDLSQANDYDFTDLPPGSTVNNSRVLTIKSLTFAENQGTVTLDGTAATATSEHQGGTWSIPSGTTVDYRLYYKNEWGDTKNITVTGAGRVKFSTANGLLFSSGRNWVLKGSVVMELATTTRFLDWARVYLDESAKLVLSADNPISFVTSNDKSQSACVDVGSHTLKFVAPNFESSFAGKFVGTGTVFLTGGRCMTQPTDWTDFNGILSLANYSVTSLKALGGSAVLQCRDNGMVTLVADQTLARLEGEGTTGGVSVPSGKTLTVNATENRRRIYNARITGAGGLAKAGASSELVLGGANDYQGATTVSEGTLTAANAVRAYPPGLVNRWSFEGDSGRFDDSGPGCNHLTYKNAAPTFSPDGVGGSQCVHFDREVNDKMTLITYASSHMFGTNHFTVSAWFRPEELENRTIFYGAYSGTQDGELYANLNDPAASDRYTVSVGGFGWTSQMSIALNQWHHIVVTQTATERIVYIDGVRRNSKIKNEGWNVVHWNFQIGNYHDWPTAFQGDIDEVLTFDRALSADEVVQLYKTPIPYAAAESEAAVVPAPVAHWAFDDKNDLGKDTSGNGYDLTSVGGVGYKTGTASGFPAGGGGVEIVNDKNPGGFRWAGTGWPAKFPKGKQSFSVSVRSAANWEIGNGGAVFSMGDMSTVNRFFSVMYGGDPRGIGPRYSSVKAGGPEMSTPYHPGSGYGYSGAANSMIHQVVVWNATTGYLSIYADGTLVEQRSGWYSKNIDISDAGSVLVGMRDDGHSGKFYGCIDDVQVFDRALSADEVRALARQLSGISAGSALAKNSPVTVDGGARLRVLSKGEQVKSLAGAGSLDVATGASLKVAEASTFTGPVSGGGTIIAAAPLTLSGDGSAFVGAVQTTGAKVTLSPSFGNGNCIFAEGFSVTTDLAGAGLPLVDTTGTVTLPATGAVTINATVDELSPVRRRFLLAKAGAFAGATDFSGWTVSPTGDYFKTKLVVENGELVLKVIPKGTVLLVY